MAVFSSDAVRLFLFFLLVFVVFGHWIGFNENTRLYTTMSVVESGDLTITEYHNGTRDKALIDGEYYADKAPLGSFLAIPGYVVVDGLIAGSERAEAYLPLFPRVHNQKVAWARFAAVASVSAVAGALTVVLLFHIFLLLGSSRRLALGQAALGGMASLIFPYSTTFHGTMLGTFFLVFAVFLWMRSGYAHNPRTAAVLSAVLGLGVTASYLVAVPGAILLSLLLREAWRSGDAVKTGGYMLGAGVLGLLPLILYNVAVFGHPFDFTFFYAVDPAVEGAAVKEAMLSFVVIVVSSAIRLLFDPIHGLFIYIPILLFSVIGVRELDEQHRPFRRLVIAGFVAGLVMAALLPGFPKAYYGARYLLPASTLLLIPALHSVPRLGQRGRILFGGAAGFSLLVMLASTQPWTSFRGVPSDAVRILSTPASVDNRLFQDYLPDLLVSGLQSPVLSSLTGMTDSFHMVLSPYPDRGMLLGQVADTLISYDGTLVWPLLLALTGGIVFRQEFEEVLTRRQYMGAVAAIIFLLFAGVSTGGAYQDGWYAGERITATSAGRVGGGNLSNRTEEKPRWARGNATLWFRSDAAPQLLLAFTARSMEPRNLTILFNGESVRTTAVSRDTTTIQLAGVREGLNVLSFRTPEPCTVMGRVNGNDDVRCTTVGITDLRLLPYAPGRAYTGSDAVERDGYSLLTGDTEIYVAGEGRYAVVVAGHTLNGTVPLQVSAGNTTVEATFDGFPQVVRTPYIPVEGLSHVDVDLDCDPPCRGLNLTDVRAEPFPAPARPRYDFAAGWYTHATGERYRWSRGNATIHLYNYQNRTIERSLWIEGRSFNQERVFSYTLNGEMLGEKLVPTTAYTVDHLSPGDTRTRNVAGFNVELRPGMNTVRIASTTPCEAVGDVAGNADVRCASFGLKEFYLDDGLIESAAASLGLGTTFQQVGSHLAVNGSGTVYVQGDGVYGLDIEGRMAGGRGTLHLSEDGSVMDSTRVDTFPFTFTTPFRPVDGDTRVTLNVTCTVAPCTLLIDTLRATAFQDQPRDLLYTFGRNWYRKLSSEDYRWSMGNATIHLYNYDSRTKNRTLWVAGKAFAEPRNITYRWNDEVLGTRTIRATDYKILRNETGTYHGENKYGFPVTVRPGENMLELSSPTDCISMAAVNDNDDVRCSLFGFDRLYLTTPAGTS